MTTIINVTESPPVDSGLTTVDVNEITVPPEYGLLLANTTKVISPYSAHGGLAIQAHVSPMENLRVTGFPRVSNSYTLPTEES